MSKRLAAGGRLIDRARRVSFTFNGRRMTGFAGDTLASALLANDQVLVGRSFKYHRPRGIVASGPEEPNALMNLGSAGRFEPNQRATTTEIFDGLTAASQNHWPSLETDVGVVNNALARFLPAGFYYKTFIHPRAAWKHLFEPIIRKSAGLGKAPTERDADRYEQAYAFCDVLVAGGGIAGLQAALTAAEAGRRVVLLEQTAHWGGRAPVDDAEVGGKPAQAWVDDAVARLAGMANVTLRLRTMVAGVYDHGYVLADERIAEHTPGDGRPRQRLWRIRAGEVVAATGAIERPLAFAGNDVPGVMLAGAVRDYVTDFAVAPGERVVVVTNNDSGYLTALALHAAGVAVPAILDARPEASGPLAGPGAPGGPPGRGGSRDRIGPRRQARHRGRRLRPGGRRRLDPGHRLRRVAMSGGWSPVVHLWSHCGGKLRWDEALSAFVPDADRPPTNQDGAPMVRCVGAAAGVYDPAAILGGEGRAPDLPPTWVMPHNAPYALRSKMWLDYQNDVKVSDVQLAAREGFTSVEHAKRYTTLGMATDQGKLSNINGIAVLSHALDEPIPQVGTTTFRPPYVPVTLGALAGRRGARSSSPHARPRCWTGTARITPTTSPWASGAAPTAIRGRARPTRRRSTARCSTRAGASAFSTPPRWARSWSRGRTRAASSTCSTPG